MSGAGEQVIDLRDGTVTFADVWVPDDADPGPTILVRTPYGKRTLFHQSPIDALTAMERGFRFVVQDVRGRGRSSGTFQPFEQEAEDGSDTIGWIRDQPWSDGSVLMTGPSYVGAVQWLAASHHPAGLEAIAPLNTSPFTGEGWTFTNGVRELGFLTSWVCGALAPADMRSRIDHADADPHEAVRALPASRPWFEAEPDAEYWAASGLTTEQVAGITIPVFTVTGWYDIFVNGALRAWRQRAHPCDRLAVGPWGHDNFFSHLNGDADLGYAGSGEAADLGPSILDFFEEVLARRAPRRRRVQLYELGSQRWAQESDWPVEETSTLAVPIPESSFIVDLEDLPRFAGVRGLRVGTVSSGWGPREVSGLLGRKDVAVIDLPSRNDDVLISGAITARIACGYDNDPSSQWVAL